MKTEQQFENELIEYLSTGTIQSPENKTPKDKLWKYEPDIKTTDDLWDNFKTILEQHNQDKLKKELSETEFNQIKKVINDLDTPYKAGQFIYGMNGTSQIEVGLDDGRHVILTVFDQNK